ncbi:hypothetical protein [Streptococcus pneumoniae]|uniref:hypothetical protein n=1 Tax=Streptococcus pneumoniae TaxID=1313 RepID=UPI0005E140C0|nr:hypothetical protein [Streptococcus pneumoniae]CNA65918.1 chlorohydrolase [Streptococcus pneumoniae]
MKIKDQTRKLAAGSSKHGFEGSKYCFEVADATLTRFEEIFEEYKTPGFSYS